MHREALAQFDAIYLSILAFFLFFLTFLGIFVFTYRKSAKKHYEKMARLPLNEGNSDD